MNNLQFYLNKFPSAPDGNTVMFFLKIGIYIFKMFLFCSNCIFFIVGTDIYIESFLKEWKNDYKKLERVHSYIQWYVLYECLTLFKYTEDTQYWFLFNIAIAKDCLDGMFHKLQDGVSIQHKTELETKQLHDFVTFAVYQFPKAGSSATLPCRF